ncbi:MAG: PKD domain-containing protein [Candidatus Omnitrophica bacterium]|nr:PKD domain-containing protein [Candidatus Omnitrophota bacterium]
MKKKVLVFIGLISTFVYSETWLSGYKYRVELLIPEAKDNLPIGQVAAVKINLPAKEDGSDIRITDENGNQINFYLARKGPGNFYEILFPARGKKYFLFCGNPDITSPTDDYRPQRGVVLELYNLKGENFESVESCKKIIEASRKKENFVAATLRKNIYDASNPITQSGYFLKVYTGFFYLDKKETISFGTTSSGASLVFVDDKMVASKTTRRWVEGFIRPEYSGTAELEPGLHKLVYYHFEIPGWVHAVCAMKRQGEEKFNVISDDFFLPVLEAKTSQIEKHNSPVCAFFSWKNINYLYREKWEFLTFQFSDASTGKNEIVSWQWDFGDGQTSNLKNPVHTYFLKKIYPVTLTVKDNQGNSDTISMNVLAQQDYGILVLAARSSKEYIEEFQNFDITKLPDEELFALAEIFSNYNVKEKEFECYSEMLKRKIDHQRYLNVALAAGELATQLKKYPEAVNIYQKLVLEENLAEARIKLGNVLVEIDDYEKAQEQFNAILSQANVPEKMKREATIGLGDIARCKGDKKSALKFYESVSADTDVKRKTGAYYQQVSFYLKKNDFSTAIEKLQLWAQEIPVCKLNGSWSLLYARAYLGAKDFERALREIDIFTKLAQQDDSYYGWALYWKAEILISRDEKEKAKVILNDIIEKFSETQISKTAKTKLQEIEK